MEIICTPNTTILQWTQPWRSTNYLLLDSTVEMQVSVSPVHSIHYVRKLELVKIK